MWLHLLGQRINVHCSSYSKKCILLLLMILVGSASLTTAMDNLELLTGTLAIKHRLSCIDRPTSLRCPPGTNVIIKLAQFVNPSPNKGTLVCNSPPNMISNSPTLENKNKDCQWPGALQTAVEACRSKEQCQFQVSSSKLGDDFCSSSRAFVQVQYSCRPHSFSSKVCCENERLQFQCEPNTRLAIYSASYGRTQYQSVQCPQPQGVAEETCLLSYATEIVLEHCHGKRNCTLTADSKTFRNPCQPKSKVYLKVIYACVPRNVLLDRYEQPASSDEYPLLEEIDHQDVLDNPESLAPSPDFTNKKLFYNQSNSNAISSYQYPPSNSIQNATVNENREKLYIYLVGGVSGILVSMALFAVVRLLWSRHSAIAEPDNKYRKNSMAFGATLAQPPSPHPFSDEISEVDADITMAQMMPPVTVLIPSHHRMPSPSEVVRYGKDGMTPRSLCQEEDRDYYYG